MTAIISNNRDRTFTAESWYFFFFVQTEYLRSKRYRFYLGGAFRKIKKRSLHSAPYADFCRPHVRTNGLIERVNELCTGRAQHSAERQKVDLNEKQKKHDVISINTAIPCREREKTVLVVVGKQKKEKKYKPSRLISILLRVS